MMFDDSGEISNIDYSRIVFKSVLEDMAAGRANIATTGLGRVFAVVMSFAGDVDPKETAMDISCKTAEYIESNYGLNLHIAISSIKDNLFETADAYQECENLQEYMRFLNEETAIVTPDSLNNMADEFANNGFTGQLHTLNSLLEAEKYDYVPDILSNILEQYVIPLKKNYKVAQSRIRTIACILAETVLYFPHRSVDNYDLSEELRNAETPARLKSAADRIFPILYAASCEDSEDDPVIRACQYIKDNFQNPDMKVTEVVEQSGVSAQHLNRLFHKKMGIKVTAYIQRQRIIHAKILLQDTNLPIAEIAKMSGYNSMSAFSYNFHNLEKISPGSFREQVMHINSQNPD